MADAAAALKLDVAHLAREILDALRSEHRARLQRELDRVSRLIPGLQNLDTFEKERLEALESVMLSLESPIQCRA